MKPIKTIFNSPLFILLPSNFKGLTLGHTIRFRYNTTSLTMMAHEIVHVKHWEEHGWKFPFKYILAWIKAGFCYKNNPFEIEAVQLSYGLESWIIETIREQKLLPDSYLQP